MSCKNRMSAAETEATIRGSDDVPAGVPEGEGTKKRGVQAGDEETTGDSGGSVRLAGQAGLGKMQVEGAVESRL